MQTTCGTLHVFQTVSTVTALGPYRLQAVLRRIVYDRIRVQAHDRRRLTHIQNVSQSYQYSSLLFWDFEQKSISGFLFYGMETPYRDLCPPLRTEEFAALEKSILAEGGRDPLVVWDDKLLDGHNRLAICQMHGLEYQTRTVSLPDEEAARQWIFANQLGRRNLTDVAFKYMLGQLYNSLKKQHGGTRKASPQGEDLKTSVKLAREHRVSKSTVERSGRLAEQIDALPAKQKEQVLKGETTIQKIKRAERKQEKANRTKPDLSTDDCQVYHCAVADLKAENLDAIITDPPYPKEYLPVYDDLVEFAARSLKPGGSLLVMVGQSYLPEIIKKLTAKVKYHWTACYLTPGGQASQRFEKKVNCFWKPLLWLVKDEYEGDWVGDVCQSPPNHNEKDHHHWGQSEKGMADIIERWTRPGQLVCDPFLGGGTTAVVCARLGRRFIGCDIESNCVKETKARIEEEFNMKKQT